VPRIVHVELSRLELLLRKQGKDFRFAKLEFAEKDTSVYLRVDAATGQYFYGQAVIPPGQPSLTFDFTTQFKTTDPRTHLSIHESGQVHARVTRASSTAPTFTLDLPSFNGEHAATVLVDNLDALRPSTDPPGPDGELFRLALNLPSDAESARVALYINGHAEQFADACRIVIRAKRPTATIFLGLRPTPQNRLGSAGISGTLAISGMRAVPLEEPMPVVYLRGQ
jgi:hypothetical protein